MAFHKGVRETCRVLDSGFIGFGVLSPAWTLSDSYQIIVFC